jgi:hypothetical protein
MFRFFGWTHKSIKEPLELSLGHHADVQAGMVEDYKTQATKITDLLVSIGRIEGHLGLGTKEPSTPCHRGHRSYVV